MSSRDRAGPLDVSLEDAELKSEVRIMADLIVASNESDGPLCQEQIDRILEIHD